MKYSLGFLLLLSLVLSFAGCAGDAGTREIAPGAAGSPAPRPAKAEVPERPATLGLVEIDVASALGRNLPSRVDFFDALGTPPLMFELPTGMQKVQIPTGDYRVYVHVYDGGVPILSEIEDITVEENGSVFLAINILEGSGQRALHQYDQDGDLALDRVELQAGTRPDDAASIPGRPMLPFDRKVLSPQARWYRGELHAHTHYGRGTESVAQLIRRAERAGLDFLAITDRNTMEAIYDPDYKSSSVVLIPAVEWGNDERGYALIYGPRTEPDPPSTVAAAQAECLRVQAQGGVFAVAHPNFPHAPWLWGLSYVNAVQVWQRGWLAVPPMGVQQLPEAVKVRMPSSEPGRQGGLIHSIAAAAAASDLDLMSANVQSTRFWDYELVRGLKAAGIAGSGSASPKVALGEPLTYIYAEEKSLPAIIEGLRLGRTYMSSGPNGPKLNFSAKVLVAGGADVGIGGVVPLNVETQFTVGVMGAKGKKIQVLNNGRPVLTQYIEDNAFVVSFKDEPKSYSVYRARVIGEPSNPREAPFGNVEVYAMTSPIYAEDITKEILWNFPNLDPNSTWVTVERDWVPEVTHYPDVAPVRPGQVIQRERQEFQNPYVVEIPVQGE